MVAMNSAEIVHRLFFTRGLNWVQELSIILAMTLYFLVYALIAKDREYIRIDLVARFLGRQNRRALAIAIRLVVLAFQGMLAWTAVKTTQFSIMFETPVLGWSEWVFYAPLAVGCADIFATELVHLAWQLRGVELEEECAGIVT
jgi:TRAP-type C4-dicarboxylate transport system permease small subunit